MNTTTMTIGTYGDKTATDVADLWRQALMGDAQARRQLLQRIMRGGGTQAVVMQFPRTQVARMVETARAA